MSYIPTNWVSGETPLSAENMNHIEQGISDLNSKLTRYVATNYGSTLRLQRIGKAVFGYMSSPTAVPSGSYKTLCTLPDGYIPDSNHEFDTIVPSATSSGTVRIKLTADSNIVEIYNYTSNSSGALNIRFNGVWIAKE